MRKANHLWRRQGISNLDAELIEDHVGCRLQKPTEVRWGAIYEALEFLKKKIDAKDDKLGALLNLLGERAFTEDELSFLTDYLILMKPIIWGLNKLQSDVGMGYALPTIVMVKRKINDALPKVTIGKPLADAEQEKTHGSESQVTRYLASESKDLSLLKQFPEIEKLYRKLNVGTPSSEPVERFFSNCSTTFGKKRRRLTDPNFEAHVCLYSNKKRARKN